MGIYFSQLPPAELARLKAELAETIITNLCYPRFFDYRTDSLRMRPVDRAKRQEVWLFLSSVDFTSWNRIDLMSVDFQRQLERLFIQFVQRNRAFFGEQGRKRMPDVRVLIGSSAASVAQGLRGHITGQRTGTPPFGSPRPPISWHVSSVQGHVELGWEQVAAQTMLLQQQLQEARGEIKPSASVEVRPASPANGSARRSSRSQSLQPQGAGASVEPGMPAVQSVQSSPSAPNGRTPAPQQASTPPSPPSRSRSTTPLNPSTRSSTQTPTRPIAPAAPAPSAPARRQEPNRVATEPKLPSAPAAAAGRSAVVNEPALPAEPVREPTAPTVPVATPTPAQARSTNTPSPVQSLPAPQSTVPQSTAVQQAPVLVAEAGQRVNTVMQVGEEDIAIFEQMQHQLLIWLRIEAIRAGVDSSGQDTSRLLELLRQQHRVEETRLQVISTLLNLSSQILKSGQVSVVDYKQALMFHLMHTRG